MAVTTNLGTTKPVSEHDENKVASYNAVADEFDSAIAGFVSISVAGSSNVTLTTDQGINKIIKLTGVLTGNITVFIRVPAGTTVGYSSRSFILWNATTGAFTVTIKTTRTASAGVVVTQSHKQLLFHDDTNVLAAAASIA